MHLSYCCCRSCRPGIYLPPKQVGFYDGDNNFRPGPQHSREATAKMIRLRLKCAAELANINQRITIDGILDDVDAVLGVLERANALTPGEA